jgi:hypothetical protein
MGRRSVFFATLVAASVITLLSCATRNQGNAAGVTSGSITGDEAAAVKPQLGAIKLMNGVEYIYARNVRWTPASQEPEYVWVRKDLYSPGLIASLNQPSMAERKELDQLRERIERLEAELKKKRD